MRTFNPLSLYALLCLIFAFTACEKTTITTDTETRNFDKEKILELINEVRATGCNCGTTVKPAVRAVTWDDLLEEAATKHSEDMAENNFMSHTGSNGSSISDRVLAVGHTASSVAENVARGFTSEEAVFNGWMASTGHCNNIMNGNMTAIGLGRSGNYWTLVLTKS
ncbi:CAP domain-containing protein [Aureispira anguillae]|uniref:CAP domain-containing protein n=1 Tax=Aureispira anguillae TaxID=2864201 RepID=A0A915YF33_9BACT|nr:CAP domain-containing protein [Aureispira anguillae]BDS11957.1 CAP domain-containing protein [Aureispira anguillae]